MPFIGFCYPCQVLLLENLLFLPPLTSSSHLLHLSPTNVPVTCRHRGTQPSSIWRFAPAEILFLALSLLGKRFFAFRFQNHPPTRNLASNLRVTCVHLGTNLGLGSNKPETGTLKRGEELWVGAPRFRPSELQTTPPPGPGAAAAAAVLQDYPSPLARLVTITGHYCNEPPRRLQDVRHLNVAALLRCPSASPDGWPVAG